MIIATDDSAFGVQIHLRIGADVRANISVDDIDEYDTTGDNWIIDPALLSEPSWIQLALVSRGAVIGDENRPVEETLEQASKQSALSRQVHGITPTYIGSLSPRVVFVGDQPNPNTKLPRMTFQPGGTGCGDFLLAALNPPLLLGIQIGLMNAYYGGDPQDLPFPDVRYVALGQSAGSRLTELGIVHGLVDHPQYIRRFHHDQRWQYAVNLANATEATGPFEALIR